MRIQARFTTATAAVLTCGVAAVAVQASESPTNTPMQGKTSKKGVIASNYDAGKRKLRNLSLDFGCGDVGGGKPIYTASSTFGRIYATVSSKTGKFKATIKTTYGLGKNGVSHKSLGKATITIDGTMKSRPGKVTGTGTVTVATAQCTTGKLKYSWRGTNGT
jgi:hypothetical protein